MCSWVLSWCANQSHVWPPWLPAPWGGAQRSCSHMIRSHIFQHTHAHTLTHTQTETYACTYTNPLTQQYIHTHNHRNTQMHTHTHTHCHTHTFDDLLLRSHCALIRLSVSATLLLQQGTGNVPSGYLALGLGLCVHACVPGSVCLCEHNVSVKTCSLSVFECVCV